MKVSNPFAPPIVPGTAVPVTECRACPRLVEWRELQAGRVPPRFAAWVAEHGFWARPVAAFGDPAAWLVIVGLAPAAQGANRTGRMFTGDRSGDFLYSALHRAGLANLPDSDYRGDGLALDGALITAPLRCAPPGNRQTAAELDRCRAFMRSDLTACRRLRVVLALGRVAHEAVLRLLREQGTPVDEDAGFRHGAAHGLPGGVWLVDSYHVSQQNTFTGRLTAAMFDEVLGRCRRLAERGRDA
ncbi:MAG TPA: uracil-DNA glycosylase [Thermoanaerobaculaceae bacterium]|nr:uracil-DNA glycosylase [Thermoanaerobaculaceae bacterium]